MSLIPYHPREGREIVLCVKKLPRPFIHGVVLPLFCLRWCVLLTLIRVVATTIPLSSVTQTLIALRFEPPNAQHATSHWAVPRPLSGPLTGSTR